MCGGHIDDTERERGREIRESKREGITGDLRI